MLKANEAASPLVLDSGNALFRNAGTATEADRARAAFIFEVMGRLGTRAMAVGQRDLSAGTAYLEALGKKGPVRLLSANLVRGGKRVFEAGTVVEVAGVRVGLVGLSAPGPIAPDKDVAAGPTVPALQAALATLGPRDVTVVLAATSYADAMQLSTALPNQVDFVIQSGEFRGAQPAQRLSDTGAWLMASAQRGQALARVALSLGSGKGAFVDLSVTDRDRRQLEFLEQQVKTLEQRLASAKDRTARGQLEETLAGMKARRDVMARAAAQTVAPGARTMRLEWLTLGSDVADDPALKAEVLKIEPSYAGAH